MSSLYASVEDRPSTGRPALRSPTSVPDSLDAVALERLVGADEAAVRGARGREDEAVHRVADGGKRAERHRLFDVERENGVSGVTGESLEDPGRTDPKAALLVKEEISTSEMAET